MSMLVCSPTHAESIRAIPNVGVQLETHRGLPSVPQFSRTERTCLPRDTILDFFMLEAIQRYQIVDYAAIATRAPGHPESEALRVVFPHLRPPPSLYIQTYQKLHDTVLRHAPPPTHARVDASKICISGSSSGGLTVLRALCDYPSVFCAGFSAYGVCDLTTLADISHKFEHFYIQNLLGGAPGDIPHIYRARSPYYTASRIRTPVLLCQGSDDKVVPPQQSRRMAEAIKENGGAVTYLEFPGEGHGMFYF